MTADIQHQDPDERNQYEPFVPIKRTPTVTSFDQEIDLKITEDSKVIQINITENLRQEKDSKIREENTTLKDSSLEGNSRDLRDSTFIKTKRGKQSRLPKQVPAVDESLKTDVDWGDSLVVNSCSYLRRKPVKTDRKSKVKSKISHKSPKFSEFTDDFSLKVTGL